MPMQWGDGPGLTAKRWGQRGGTEQTYLNVANMPSHTHTAIATMGNLNVQVTGSPGDTDNPIGNVPARSTEDNYGAISSPPATMAEGAVTGTVAVQNMNAGGNLPFDHMPPYLCVSFIIALQGIFPSRS